MGDHRSGGGGRPFLRRATSHPFTDTSPWNIPLGSGALFESAAATETANLLSGGVGLNAESFSHPIYQAAETDPLVTVTVGGSTFTYRIPAAAVPALGSDAHLHVIQPDKRYVFEAWMFAWTGPTTATSSYVVRVDMLGTGFAGGVRAYGGAAIGGLIRSAELDAGSIPHVVAIALGAGQLKSGFVYPATSQDGDHATSYTGQVPMGRLVGIPPSTDVTTLGLTADGLVLARALQDYGAYVVDRASNFVFFAEPGSSSTRLAALRTDLAVLRGALRVITNNAKATPGGNGTRRRPFAAPVFTTP